ncbi:MAG: TlpA family protein disulfide reductase [Chloroflexi bacterium]|nr:TlpA family protein disulfide reductase [Chloroflexota bacterium]
MRNRIVLVLVLAGIVCLIAGLWLLKGGASGGSDAPDIGKAALIPGTTQPTLQKGSPAPDFEISYPNGKKTRLSDLKGKPVLVNFWATWCPPCRAEVPEIQKAYERYKANGFVVVAVNVQESSKDVAGFMEKYGMTFTVAIDSSGAVGRLYRVSGIPASFFVDRAGIVREIFVGSLTAADLDRLYDLIK